MKLTRERDSQRARLYRAEDVLRPFCRPLGTGTVADVEAYVAGVWGSRPVQVAFPCLLHRSEPPKVKDGRGALHARACMYTIVMPRWARTEYITLHELAHIIKDSTYGSGPAAHGWQYAGVYLKLVRFMLGDEAHDALRQSFKLRKVQFEGDDRVIRVLTRTEWVAAMQALAAAAKDRPTGGEMNDLLGGAIRGKTCPRGFVDWRPQAATLALLEQVRGVLVEYTEYLPLTVRQVFYRLVGAHGYDKTERAYERLGEALNRARRAELVDMDAIRDGGGARDEPHFWQDADEFLLGYREAARDFRLDRQDGQPTRLLLLCEAADMVPQLARAVEDYGLPVISSGGFESVTEKHALALDLARHGEPVEVLHIGDHDPSGAHLFLALAEDVEAFGLRYGLEVTFTRLAVIPAQVEALALPTAPPKTTDNRAFAGETCQAEAIAPDDLAAIIRAALDERIDPDAYDAVLGRERAIRDDLAGRLETR